MDHLALKKTQYSRQTIGLLFASFIGFTLQLLVLVWPEFNVLAISPTCAWMFAMLYASIKRPTTVPTPLLLLYCTLFTSQLIVLVERQYWSAAYDVPMMLILVTALVASTIAVTMPLRDPNLSSENISAAFSPPTYALRSPEENLSLWQFMTVSWMSPLISLGAKKQLNEGEVWSLAKEFQHTGLHHAFRELRGSVIVRLLRANGLDLIVISLLGILELLANLAVPFLLQQLLSSMENSESPRRASATYAGISLAVRLIACQSAVFKLWFSRRCYERSRGEMITMLHEKTLSRKVIGINQKQEKSTERTVATTDAIRTPHQSVPFWQRILKCFYRSKSDGSKSKATSTKPEQIASMGKILNLLRNDVYEVAQRFWEFPDLITKPLGLLLSVILVWKLIGWSCFLGVITVFAAQTMNALIARILLKWERKRRVATDKKLQKTSQVVESIRHLRWYGWQESWLAQILDARQRELRIRIVTGLWGIAISFTNSLASGMFPVVAFFAYTALAGLPLRVDVAFPALQLFSILQNSLREIPSLITVLLNASVAVGRINDFMEEEDLADERSVVVESTKLELKQATFAWPGNTSVVLRDISVRFPRGLTVVCGGVGSGKTALLQALMGELDKLSGVLVRPDEMIGYCAQTPWLQSMNIRDNILFSSPYEDIRYKEVLHACALDPDLATFQHGDLSNLGENGIGLSGGQRARVALARAVYSKANILLLDDPFSALDYQTSELIVRRCLRGQLMQGRTIVLVTHRQELCQRLAKQVIEISGGCASTLDDLDRLAGNSSSMLPSERSEDHEQSIEGEESATVPEKFLEDEHREHGGVKLAVYWEYIKAGKLKWWALLTCVLVTYRLVTVTQSWFIKQWGEGYNDRGISMRQLFDNLPSPEENIRPWLIGFFLIAMISAFVTLLTHIVMLVIVYSAGRKMFEDIMYRVCHATFRFYDVTPVGRLMNRLTSDIGTIDGNISQQFRNVAFLAISWLSAITVIASVTPTFLIFSVALAGTFIFIFLRFLPTSQSLRRLEMVSLSPLMSNFGTLLNGLMTVRAFHAQSRFQDGVIAVTDAFQRMDHFYWSLQAWLMYRFDLVSACSTFLVTLIALYTGVSPGLTAFVLIAASKFVNSTHNICKQYGQLQMDFVSVERIVELLHVEQEPVGTIKPPAWWPAFGGDVIFEDVTIRYMSHLDPALSSIFLQIKGGSNTAIIGRTGSGKSTLALSLLATIRPESGRILIDGFDVSTVETQALRNRVTFLAQDPVLFPGTMRENLDPLEEHTDEECEAVLRRICNRHNWTLQTELDTGGKNISQGQRQLVGLARAVLRRSAVVIFDEATASIDQETSMEIQQIIREEMRGSTVITIAHRLEAVKDADYYIVLDKGRVLKQERIDEAKPSAEE